LLAQCGATADAAAVGSIGRRFRRPWPHERNSQARCRIAIGSIVLGPSKQEEARMPYVDGFVVPVPKQNIEAYKAMARKAGEVWKEFGALAYVESLGDDVPYGQLTSFPRAVQAKDDEIIAFSWVVYPSREQRDQIIAKVMADPRLKGMMSDMPFDGKRLIYGGFETFLEL
jgi:uncharacterized protein YbaA (DUF1428 family)